MEDDQIEAAEEKGVAGIQTLVDGLNQALDDEDPEIAEAILDACLRMSSSSKDVCKKLGEFLSTTFSDALEKMMEEAVVIEVLLAVLVKAITTESNQIAFGGTETNVQLLLRAMSIHGEDKEETLVEYGCLVIEKLAQDNELVQQLLLSNGVARHLKSAETIITNVRNKKYVRQARAALIPV